MQHNRNTYGVRRTPTPKLIDCVLDKTFNRHACFLLPCGAEELEILIKVRTYNPTDAGTALVAPQRSGHKMPLRLTLVFSSVAGLKRGKHGFVLRSYAAVLCWHGAIVAGDVILVVCWLFFLFFHLIFNAHLSFM